MIVPYTTERRADTGVNNVTLGMWLFIASEVMLFGALFSAYALLRSSAIDWPSGRQVLSLSLGVQNTLALLLLTNFVWVSRRSPAIARRMLLIASLIALVFLGMKAVEWKRDFNTGLFPRVSTFLAMYFTLTGLHALHVIAGFVANVWVLRSRVDDAMFAGRVRALAIYWVFVDIVWLIIFVLMYLL